jgi:hypothetical protein
VLQQQLVSVDFTQGLDKKSDEKLVLPGKLTSLQNSAFDGPNTLGKAGGYTQLSDGSILGGGHIASADGLMKLGDELLVGSARTLYSAGGAGLVSKGRLPKWGAQKRPLIRNNATQSGFDVAVADTVELHAWQDSRGGIRVTVRDTVRGTLYQADVSVSATGVLPRCLSNGATFFLLYVEGNNLQLRTLSAAAPQAFGAAVTVLGNAANVTQQMDALYETAGAVIYLAYRSSGNQLEIRKISTAGAVLASITVAENPTRGLCVAWNSTASTLAVFDHENGAGNLNVRVYTAALVLSAGPTVVEAGGVTVWPRMCALANAGAAGWRLFYEQTNATVKDTRVRFADISGAAVVTSGPADFQRGAGLGSQPFDTGGDRLIALTYEAATPNLQPTVFVVKTDVATPEVVARLVAGVGGGILSAARLPNVPADKSGIYILAVNEKGRLTVETKNSGTTIIDKTPEGISVVELDSAARLQALPVADLLFLCGANPAIYDGRGIVEAGFHLFPEKPGIAVTVGGGVLTAGTYGCVLVYEWTDNRGRRWVSAASEPAQVTVAANDRLTWTMPTLRITRKKSSNGHANVRIVPYRTEANGAVYYRVAAPDVAPENDVTVDSVAFADQTVTDANLVANEPLYAQSTLDAGPVPPCRTACIHENRVTLAQLEDGDRIALSLQVRDGEGLRFNEDLRYLVPANGTDLETVLSMAGRLYALRQGGILAWDGNPPNDAGGGSDFTEPRVVSPDVGCSNFRSLVETPDGWMFESGKGRYLLARNEQLAYLGGDVETYTEAAIAAVCLRAKDQARWYTASGDVLIYDWTYRQWSTLTEHEAAGAVEWGGSVVHAAPGGTLYIEGGYTHDGAAIQQLWETGWLRVAGLNGFQRVWQALFVGQSYSPCILTVEIAFDFADYSEQFEVDVGASFGAVEVPLALRHHLSQQKCSVVRFRITESDATAPYQGVRLTELSLSVGVKKGPRKFPAAKTF